MSKSSKSGTPGPATAGDTDWTPLAERTTAALLRLASEPLAPGLYLVATPIGNLGDVSLRAIAVLARADLIYCEDTRHSRTLLDHFAIRGILKPYHEHNARAERPRVLAALEARKRVALISDAGTPLVSDPGYKLVRDALDTGHAVVSIPGPSAVLAALTSAGLPTDSFFFAGFLPTRTGARRQRIAELAAVPATLTMFEAPTRVAETLADLAEVLGPRPAAVARELTKLHETVVSGTLDELARRFAASDTKGELVIVVGPPGEVAVSDAAIVEKLARALPSMSLSDAAKSVADMLGVPKARVYELGLALKQSGD